MKRPLAVTILLVVPLLVLAVHGWAVLRRPPGFNTVVAELGSIGRFLKEPVPNHAGTELLFIETTERGYGVFLCDLPSGKRTLLFEQVDKGPTMGFVHETFLGWAPDDSCFAYCRENNGWQIAVCDGKTGATQGAVSVENEMTSGAWLTPESLVVADSGRVLYTVRQFQGQWLHPLRFKCFRDTGHNTGDDAIEELTAWGNDAVGWRQGNAVWKCGAESEAPVNILDAAPTTTATMDAGIKNTDSTWYEMGYNMSAPETGLPVHGSTFVSPFLPDHAYTMGPDYTAMDAVLIESALQAGTLALEVPAPYAKLSFLTASGNGATQVGFVVHRADNSTMAGTFKVPDWFSGDQPACIANGRANRYPNDCEAVNSGFPKLFAADVSLEPSDSPITKIDLAYTSGAGHAAILAVSGRNAGTFHPILVTGYNADMIREARPVDSLAQAERMLGSPDNKVSGKGIRFVIQSLNDEPPGIWEYGRDSAGPHCVVPNVEKPFHYVVNARIEEGNITNAAGDRLTYYLLAPTHNATSAKHPLVVGILGNNERGFTWSHNHEAFANCGAYFVSVDRRNRSYSQWAGDALSVYEALISKLAIDTKDVWLYADSAGVVPVYSMLDENSGLWRGAIVFSPGGFPDPSQIHHKPMLFDCGGNDGNLAERAIQFQDEAAKMGVPVTLLIHPGLEHYFRIPQLERERMREALTFFSTR